LKRDEKEQIVASLSGKLKDAALVVVTDYRGLTVEKITQLRNELRRASSEYQVVKNTLLKRASSGTALEGLHGYLEGPTAIVISSGDPVAPAKVLVRFLKEYSELSIKAGYLEGKVLSAEETQGLSTLPGRKELLAKFVSLCASPPVRLLGTLQAIPQKFIRVLHAIEKSKSG
jgi:large subunit ribosomal protein L10